MNEHGKCSILGVFWIAIVTKWLIQRHLGYREMVQDHQREKNQERQRRETAEH